jgi:hypothetical protein
MARNISPNARKGYGVTPSDLTAMTRLVEGVIEGNAVAKGQFVEAISTSDSAAYVLADVVTAQLQTNYEAKPSIADKFATYTKRDSFRNIRFYDVVGDYTKLQHAGNEAGLPAGVLPVVPELNPYPEISLSTSEKAFSQKKRGARVSISWEAWREDPFGILHDLPGQLATLVPDTEDWYTTDALLGGLTSYSALTGGTNPDGTVVPANSSLTLAAISRAIDEVKSRKINGENVQVNRFVLMVSPELSGTVDFLKGLQWKERTSGTDTFGVSTFNPLSNIEVIENPYVPTGFWALVPAPNGGSRRIAVARFGLAGHEAPELRVENAAGFYHPGGGQVNWQNGSFINDSLAFRLRHVGGAGLVTEEAIVWSTSTGSAVSTPR